MTISHLSTRELAERWNISRRTLDRWRWAGKGPRFLKLGGRVVYRIADINAFEAAHLRSRTDECSAATKAYSFSPKRGKQRNHVTLAAVPSILGDRSRGFPR